MGWCLRCSGVQRALVKANRSANLLLADTVEETLRNVATYEQFYGRCEAWPDWLRDRDHLTELLNRELLTMDSYNDLTVFTTSRNC
jgi:hypothetical protein